MTVFYKNKVVNIMTVFNISCPAVNYKKPISSIMGFIRNAIINNSRPDGKESNADNSFDEPPKRNSLKNEEELKSILFAG